MRKDVITSWLFDPSLVLWLPFREAQGNTVYDLSGYGNNGTIYGAQWVQTELGWALSFDGVDDYVEVPRSVSLEPSYITVELWVQVNDYGVLLAKRELTAPSKAGYLFHGGGDYSIRFRVYDSNGESKEAVGPFLTPNTWYHLVGVYDGSRVIIYVNGEKYLGPSMTGSILHSDDSLLIGAQHYNGAIGGYLHGTIAEVRIYNRALSEEKIKARYEYGLRARSLELISSKKPAYLV